METRAQVSGGISTRPHGRRVSVLLIEDDRDLRTILEEALTDEGFECSAVSSVEDGLRALGTRAPDVVVFDWWGYDLHPDELRAHARARCHSNALEVVVITGAPRVARTLRERHTRVLLKPFGLEEMFATVRAAQAKLGNVA